MLTGAVVWWVSFHFPEKLMAQFPNVQLAQQWRQRLDRFDQSDLTIAEFCQAEGYSTGSFYQWRRRLVDAENSDALTFVLVDLPTGDLPRPVSGSIEVILPSGARINLPAGSELPDCRDLIPAELYVIESSSKRNRTMG
jgi:hypothetical protein